jgi:hypothetical protein
MARCERFTFLCDESERRAIADLAARLKRSQSDAVRFVVVEAAKQITQVDPAGDLRESEPTPKGGTNATTARP